MTNPLPVPITVKTLTITKVTSPAGCPASANLSLNSSISLPSDSLVVGANRATNTVEEPISLTDTASNQDACEGGIFTFTYAGTAIYTVATTTFLATSVNPVVVGAKVTYTATVNPVIRNEPSSPAGSVTFYDGVTPLTCGAGSRSFNGATATCTVTYTAVTGSPHAISASYASADTTNYANSTSAVLPETVIRAATTAAVMSNHNPAVVGQQVTYTAIVAVTPLGAGTPTGKVEFLDGTTPISVCGGASGSALSGPTATCLVTYSTPGDHTITVEYLGDPNFAASPLSPSIIEVVKSSTIATTTALAASPNPSVYGQPVTLTATVSASSGATPTGSVSFYLGTSTSTHTALGTGTLNSGKASIATTVLPTGSDSLYAVYAGTTTDAGSTSPTITQTVDKAATKTALSSSANPSVSGKSVTFTATVTVQSPGAGTPTGTVAFTITPASGPAVSCATGSTVALVNGVAQCTVPSALVASGSPYTVTAAYSGDGNFATSVDRSAASRR